MSAPREMQAFLLLPPEQQLQAIVRLHRSGMSMHGIAAATKFSVEQIRYMLAIAEPVKCERTGIPAEHCTCSAHGRGGAA